MSEQPHTPELTARPSHTAGDAHAWLTDLVLRMRFMAAIVVVIASVTAGVTADWRPSPWIGLMAIGWMVDAARRVRAREEESTEAALMVDAMVSLAIIIIGSFPISVTAAAFSIIAAAAVISLPGQTAGRAVVVMGVLALISTVVVQSQPSPWTERQLSGLTVAAVSAVPILTAALLLVAGRRDGADRMLGELLGITEAKVHHREARFATAFDSAPVGLVITDLRGDITETNAAFADMVGRELEGIIGSSLFAYIDPDDDQLIDEAFERLANDACLHDRRLLSADGSALEVVMSVARVDGGEGRAAHCVTHIMDVTERQQAYGALQRSYEELAALHRISTGGLASANMAVAAHRVARTVGTVMGFPTVEMCTHDPDNRWMRNVASTDASGLRPGQSHTEDGLCGTAALTGEIIVKTDPEGGISPRDPEVRTIVGLPIQIAEDLYGAITLSDTRLRTISEQDERRGKRLAAHTAAFLGRMHAEEALAELIRSKDQFIASVAHEVRTPLTAVVGLAAELRDRHDDMGADEALDLMDIIAEQSTDVANIVEDILVAARTDLEKLRLQVEDFDAHDQVVRVIRELHHFVGGRPVNVQPFGAAEVRGDRGRFRQIIRNLITNAFRYGGPDVRVDVFEEDGRAVVQVSDDGEGIPESEWHRIFEPYERSLTGQVHKESMGIGLTVSRKLARLMGGELSYRFEYGRSVFDLNLQRAGNAPALPGPVEPIEIGEPAARRSA